MEQKKNKILIIVLIILSIIILGLGGYIVWDKIINKTSRDSDNNVTEESLNLNDQTVLDLYNNFSIEKWIEPCDNPFSYKSTKITSNNLSDEIKVKYAFMLLKSSEFTAQKWGALTDKRVCNILGIEDSDECYYISQYPDAKAFQKTTLDNYYKKLFGINANYNINYFNKVGVDGNAPIYYIYDNTTNMFYEYMLDGGGGCEHFEIFTLTKAVKKGNQIILTESIQYTDEGIELGLKNYSIKYTFQLEVETGNYIFVSAEKK